MIKKIERNKEEQEFYKETYEQCIYILEKVLSDSKSQNKNIDWFLNYKHLSEFNNSKSKNKIMTKINSDYN